MQNLEAPAPKVPGKMVNVTGADVHHSPIYGNQSLPVPFDKFAALLSHELAIFQRQIRSSIGPSAVPKGQQDPLLHLTLQKGALQFYEQLSNAV